MKINIRAVIAVVLAVIVAYVAFDMTSTKTMSGSRVTVSINNGNVTINNQTEEPITARITSGNAFVLASSDGDLTIESTRQGSGRRAIHVFEGELPAGDLQLQVTRGADITFDLTSEDSIAVTAVPRAPNDAAIVAAVAAVLIVGLLFYASRASGHAWLRALRRQQAPPASTGEQVGVS